jgi:prepilin-type N-terminal cleavage/methylation domain-containing protein
MRNKSENGFTFIEVLVSLLIISSVGIVLYASFSAGFKGVEKSRTEIRDAVRHLQTDSVIRSAAESVQIPYWVTAYEMTAAGGSLELPWYEGKKETKTVQLPAGADIEKSELVREDGKSPFGIRITYKIGKREYTTSATFASFPAGKVKL